MAPRLTDERRALAESCVNYVRWFVRHRLNQDRKDYLGGHEECLAIGFDALCGAALRYDPAQGPFTGFLYATLVLSFTTRSTCFRRVRRAYLTGGIGFGDWPDSGTSPEPSVEPDTDEVDAADLVRLIEARLPVHRRPYLHLLLSGQDTPAEISRIVGRSKHRAGFHIEAVRETARRVLAEIS